MKKRLDKIDALSENGYQVKKSFGGIYHKLIAPDGTNIMTFGNSSEKNLPGFSPVAFWFYPFIAVQIRHWKYFWLVGIVTFLYELILAITSYDWVLRNSTAGIILGFIYGINYPYQKWLFSKSNKQQIQVWKSIVIGTGLLVLAVIPGAFIEIMANPTS